MLFCRSNYLVWVIIACIIPDLPWIVLKLGIATGLCNPYDLRLYCTTQASLIFCTILSGGLACFSEKPRQIFLLLATNCLFHLLLDSIQIKWANGVHLFIPFSWLATHFDRMWPEHIFTLTFTIFGALYLILVWKKSTGNGIQLRLQPGKTTTTGLLLITLYLAGPFAFIDTLEKSNFYFINTLRQEENRSGQYIEFDRAHYFAEDNILKTFSGERLTLVGQQPQSSGRVSLKGHFITASVVQVGSFHFHRDFRDIASVLGLLMACTLLFQSLILPRLQFINNTKGPFK